MNASLRNLPHGSKVSGQRPCLHGSHINPKPSAGQPGIAFKHEGDRFHHYEPGVFMRQRRWQAGVFFPATLCFLIAWVLTADAADPSKEPIPQPRKACELYETVTRTGLSPSSISWMRRWRCSGPEPTIFMRSTTIGWPWPGFNLPRAPWMRH